MVNYGCSRPPLHDSAVSGTEGSLDFGAQLLLSPLITVRSFLVFPGKDMIDPENFHTGLSACGGLTR